MLETLIGESHEKELAEQLEWKIVIVVLYFQSSI